LSWAIYITHPEVIIDPDVPVVDWGLSQIGRRRATSFAARNLIPKFTPIHSSPEKKALDLAYILAESGSLNVEINTKFGENDRSATGFLEPEQFEAHVEKLFRYPAKSVSGWETANDAQTRIVRAVENTLATHDLSKPIVFAGHGCVGTLLKCHLAKCTIAHSQDQRMMSHPGGGNVFVFALADRRLLCDWTAMENWKGI